MAGLANRIIRHDVEDQIFRAVIDQLVRFARLEKEGVARFYGSFSLGVTDDTFAGHDVIEFPLRTVRVVRVRNFAGWNAANLNIEWMSLVQVRGQRLASQCF